MIERGVLRGLMEVDLKTLYLLLVILFCTTTLHAEKVSILTELEMLQEKLWYLQRDIGTNKSALEEQQKQLKGLVNDINKERLQLNKRLTALTESAAGQQELSERLAALSQATAGQQGLNERLAALNQAAADQQEKTGKVENGLVALGESLSGLTAEVRQQNRVFSEQADKLGALEASLAALRDELAAQQTGSGQELVDLRKQLDEASAQVVETRARLDALGQDVGGQLKQFGFWAAGAALILCIVLTFVMALRKERGRRY
jgi:chromosome segregation ATPase